MAGIGSGHKGKHDLSGKTDPWASIARRVISLETLLYPYSLYCIVCQISTCSIVP